MEKENLTIFFKYKNDKEYYEIVDSHLSHLQKTSDKYACIACVTFKKLTDRKEAVNILKKIKKRPWGTT